VWGNDPAGSFFSPGVVATAVMRTYPLRFTIRSRQPVKHAGQYPNETGLKAPEGFALVVEDVKHGNQLRDLQNIGDFRR